MLLTLFEVWVTKRKAQKIELNLWPQSTETCVAKSINEIFSAP